MRCDFLVVGAGIAGASVGYFLAEHGSVIVLEMETVPGFHSTGRSAALFTEYYGNGTVRALTRASRGFYQAPPPAFGRPLVTPRGVLALSPHGGEEHFAAALRTGLAAPEPVRELTSAQALQYCPVLRPEWFSRAMLKPGAMDIDVNALHQGFLRGIAARGGAVVRLARVRSLTWRNEWHAVTDAGDFSAPRVVNASGAWADEVAGLAGVRGIGLTPRRRTAVLVTAPAVAGFAGWPMVADVTESFYFKPESGRMLLCPYDATPVPAGDVRPDDLDVAAAIEAVCGATTMKIRHVQRAWAGLRSTVADDTPVIGEDPGAPGFFWLAALSGYGIQSAPAAGELAAALVSGRRLPAFAGQPGFGLAAVNPGRFSLPAAVVTRALSQARHGKRRSVTLREPIVSGSKFAVSAGSGNTSTSKWPLCARGSRSKIRWQDNLGKSAYRSTDEGSAPNKRIPAPGSYEWRSRGDPAGCVPWLREPGRPRRPGRPASPGRRLTMAPSARSRT